MHKTPEIENTAPVFEVLRNTAPPPDAAWTFERLLGPVPLETFHDTYWAKHPLLVRAAPDQAFESLITPGKIEAMLAIPGILREQMVSMRAKGDRVSLAPADLGELYRLFRLGSWLQFRKMERFLPPDAPLSQLYRDLQVQLGHPGVSISCFFSPPGTEQIGPHYDATEIFTLQLAGRKRWRFFHHVDAEDRAACDPATLGPPTRTFELGPGDFLYQPRGLVHEVMCDDELSVSIPIIVEPVAWKDMLPLLIEGLRHRPDFMEALPSGVLLRPGAADRLAEGFSERLAVIAREIASMDVAAFADAAGTRVLSGLGAPAGAHVAALTREAGIGPGSVLRTRHGEAWQAVIRGGQAYLTVAGGETLKGPAAILPALQAIMARRAPAKAGALHESLSEKSSLILARELVRIGALTEAGGA